ncbi:MAG: hypothetical protein CMK65_16310 [Pseudoalteromonas sp.]|nr:hypothetical protein [Pseudoalteromonas sp.]
MSGFNLFYALLFNGDDVASIHLTGSANFSRLVISCADLLIESAKRSKEAERTLTIITLYDTFTALKIINIQLFYNN